MFINQSNLEKNNLATVDRNEDKEFILNSHMAQKYISHHQNPVQTYTDVVEAFIIPDFNIKKAKESMMDFQYTQENGCNIISCPVG